MYCEFFEKGKDHASVLQTDLKTIKGYRNRAKNMCFNCDRIIIHFCNDSTGYYNDATKKKFIKICTG
jgi:hypothetical protein